MMMRWARSGLLSTSMATMVVAEKARIAT